MIQGVKREKSGDMLGYLLRSFTLAFFLTGGPVALHIISQPVAILVCVFSAIIAARVFEQDVPVIILVANVFQNTFISLVSVNYSDPSDLEFLKSYAFITTIICYSVVAYGFLSNSAEFSPFVRRMILASVGVLGVIAVYFVLGLAVNPRSAVIYLRNIALPIFIFQIFLIVSVKHRLPVPQSLTVLLIIVMLCCYMELLAGDAWLSLTNGMHYLTLGVSKRLLNVDEIRVAKEHGMVITNATDYARSSLFNTTLTSDLNLSVQRLGGPNFNSITLAYLLSILIGFLALHGYWITVAFAMPLLIATSAKGPLVFALGCMGFFALAKRSKTDFPVKALSLGLVAYAVFVFQSGLRSGDYHVLGLLGGLTGFVKLPIGHTLGEGGNLSIEDFSKLDWSAFQRSGMAAVAVESAFGVLLYQLGVSAAFLFAFYIWIARTGWRLYKLTRAPAMAFTTCEIGICLVNGMFQEEGYFVPLSLPVVMGLAGLSLGAADRLLAPIARASARETHAPATDAAILAARA